MNYDTFSICYGIKYDNHHQEKNSSVDVLGRNRFLAIFPNHKNRIYFERNRLSVKERAAVPRKEKTLRNGQLVELTKCQEQLVLEG